MKKHIPNILTLGNLFCGCLGIIFTLSGNIYTGALFVFPALILDFLDGFVARLLKVSSPIGKELDSLADMVTFGVLPGVILFSILGNCHIGCIKTAVFFSENIQLLALLFPLFAALRLAKFNIDETQSDSFIGIPTPAATMFVVGILFLFDVEILFSENGKWILIGMTILISLAMIAPIRMLNLKFKTYNFKDNLFRYLLIVISITSIAVFHLGGLSIAIVLYILLSIINNMVTKSAKK